MWAVEQYSANVNSDYLPKIWVCWTLKQGRDKQFVCSEKAHWIEDIQMTQTDDCLRALSVWDFCSSDKIRKGVPWKKAFWTTLEFTELPLNLLNYLGFWKFKFECYKYFSPKLAASTHIATEEESFFDHPGGHVSVIHTFATIGIDKLSVFGWTFVWKPSKRMWRQFCNCNKRIDSIQGL